MVENAKDPVAGWKDHWLEKEYIGKNMSHFTYLY